MYLINCTTFRWNMALISFGFLRTMRFPKWKWNLGETLFQTCEFNSFIRFNHSDKKRFSVVASIVWNSDLKILMISSLLLLMRLLLQSNDISHIWCFLHSSMIPTFLKLYINKDVVLNACVLPVSSTSRFLKNLGS